jgi:pyrimidine operon attenuation protein/uracil phosphoribosyltransferase
MRILDENQIKQKITRLAFEIAEQNYSTDEVILLGINNNGHQFAKLVQKKLKAILKASCSVVRITLNPAKPLDHPIETSKALKDLSNKTVIIVDDVANTGRTIFYAFKPLLNMLPFKLQVLVLVDRKHKLFPIKVDYVGLSLATTMRENISVKLLDVDRMEVHLD